MRVTGIVLCGGHSRRMGRPKAWLPFGEEVLLQRVVRIVSEAVGPVIVVAAKDQDLPPLPDSVKRIDDEFEDRGPLAGLAAGLKAVDSACEAVYLSACDVPFLSNPFILRVVGSLGVSPTVSTVPYIDAFHPLAAAYRTSIRPLVEHRVAYGPLRMQNLFDEIPHCKLLQADFADVDPDLESLRNVNTPDEYAAALILYNSRHGT